MIPPLDPHSQFVSHPNGQKTHYIVDDFTDPWKPSQAILIQHGFARHAAFWYHWIPALSRHYRVIRRDLRGHGYSSYPEPESDYDYSLETILDEITDMLDQLGLEKVHFLGESTGGMIGVAFAARHPDRLHSLILCATPTHLPPSAQEMWAMGHKDWETACRTLGARGFCEGLAKIPGVLGQPDPDYNTWWREQVGVSSGEGLASYAGFLSKLDVRPMHGLINTLKVPVLILAPTRSRNTSLDDQKQLNEAITGSKMVVIDGLGHEIFVDKGEECQEAVLEFANSLEKQRTDEAC